MHDARLLRYGAAMLLALAAAVITFNRNVMLETPFFLFLGDLGERPERIERLVAFVLVTLMISSLIAALRRERNLLRESEELCRTLADVTREAVILINLKGLI